MKIKPRILKALNQQVNGELSAFYSYLSISLYFASCYIPGCARWFKIQFDEELHHTMKLSEYVAARGGKVILATIEAPKAGWKSFLGIFEDAYAKELKVSVQINTLMDLVKSEHDHATEVMLQWFVTEQVEEENTANGNVERLKLFKNCPEGIVEFDRELGQRK